MTSTKVNVSNITESVLKALDGIDRDQTQIIDDRQLDSEKASADDVAATIDHTLLKPDATRKQIVQLCEEANTYQFASVCVNLTWLALCNELLGNSQVKRCVVVGFPLGATLPAAKAYETAEAIRLGVQEVDMVLNVGQLKDGDYVAIYQDIHAVVAEAHASRVQVKVILETFLLTDEEKVAACVIAKEAGADFVKTSTGFNGGGATVEDVALMRSVVGTALGVKASGGVRTAEDALAVIKAGATRIGSSAGVNIVSSFTDSGVETGREKQAAY